MKEKIKKLMEKRWSLPYEDKIMRVIGTFSLTEKVIFYFFVGIFALSGISLLWQVNKSFMVEVPDHGGTLTEGVIGSPRFVNPILATSDTDIDLSSLIYSGLLRADKNGNLIPDLAQSYMISSDNLTYTFVLKNNAYFQDGTKVTADDVVFTVDEAQDADLKSPQMANWSGVTVTKINNETVSFTLKQPYSPFIDNLTLGILPKHIWQSATADEFPFSQYNIKAIGSGPYKIGSITYDNSGLPSEYHLVAFNKYVLGEPYITNFVIKTYNDETGLTDAYKNGDIDSLHSVSPEELPNLKVQSDDVILSPLPRIFGVFFNQNVQPVFVYKEVREALDMATDKEAIVDNVLSGYGQPIDTPVPPESIAPKTTDTFGPANIAAAQALLTKNGWTKNSDGIFQKTISKNNTVTLAFSISTGDAPELKATADLLQKQWEALGALVDVKIFETSDLNQNIIRPRKYDALLFGEVIDRDLDLYPFWDSSQRNDPGLNVAMYANIKADTFLQDIRNTTDPAAQKIYLNGFEEQVANDVPTVFTYAPYFIYIIPKNVHNVSLGVLTTPSERFADVYEWYIETNNVWKIFTK